jgi:hypothetical protein
VDPELCEPEWPPPDDDDVVGVLVGDVDEVGGFATTSTVALLVAEPVLVAPLAAPVTVAASVAVSPPAVVLGTATCACSWVAWLARIVPTVQVCVPSPLPQTVKAGAAKLGDELPVVTAICTVTSLAVPPVDQTLIWYRAASPGCTVVVAAATLTHSSVVAEADEDDLGEEEAVTAGVIVGVGPGGGELGALGSTWHWLTAASVTAECAPARAAAVVPTQSTATPANTANTEDPTRFPRRGIPGRYPSRGVNSRFSIIG